MAYSKIFLFILFLTFLTRIEAQNPPTTFHHLTVENGLNDGHIQMVGQDKFGYMWFGSLGALNRYDGRTVRTYAYRAGDSTSPLSGMAFCMASDSSGKLFFGFDNGLAEFDFLKNSFKRIPITQNWTVNRLFALDKERLFLMTGEGLVKYNPLSKQAVLYYQTDTLLKGEFGETVMHNNKLYISSDKGVVVFDPATEKATKTPLSILDKFSVSSICFDENNRLWVTTMGKPKVLCVGADFKSFEVYDRYLLNIDATFTANYFFQKDKKNRIWISTKHNGLLQYAPESNSLIQYLHDDQKPWTPLSNFHMSICCDKDGMIWLGGTEGVNYFHPDKNLFETILPFTTELAQRSRRWARSVAEDKDKNLWFGTVDGLVKYDTKNKTYREWRNEPNKPPVLMYNSLRTIFCDDNNDIWMPSSKGLSKYNSRTGKIEFLSPSKAFPQLSYMSLSKDRAGNLWFATLDGDCFYQYDTTAKILRGIGEHPQMKRFAGLSAWRMFQDSKGRYWLCFNEHGLGMFDPKTQKTYHWKSEGTNAIAGNIVMDIKEDRNGMIWIATNHGATRIDFEKNSFKTYNTDNGLGSNSVTAIAVDALNRVWIGTCKGLMMLDSSRQSMTNFGIQDGLPSLAFNEFPAYNTPSGDIIMATQKGYVRFNPLNYVTEKRKLDCYIGSFTIANIETPLYPIDAKAIVKAVFEAHENSFSLNLVALNYFNPTQTWFAYKLDGFDTDWHITQDPKAVYSNLSGGNYTFRYKASLNVNDWDVVEKSLPIHINTPFYKALWFKLFLLANFGLLWFWYSRNRKKQKDSVESLQRKAQLLEKEKAVMQYEGLKQQLNPHFLFNSLTSLSSLIQIDPKIANEFLENLSKTYRYILKSSESETVLLSDEIKFAENYIMLQKTRFETGLIINFNISEEALHHKIVPVTLQNLIENAIKHNIIDTESPLVIDIFTEPDSISTEGGSWLIIQNNLQKKNYVETSNKRGLNNLTNLYHYITNKPVEITETADFFTVKIPLI